MKMQARTAEQKEIFAACTPFLFPIPLEEQEPGLIGLGTNRKTCLLSQISVFAKFINQQQQTATRHDD
jgi:hypothetical protein